MDFTMSEEDMKMIDGMNKGERICDGYEWLFGNSIFA